LKNERPWERGGRDLEFGLAFAFCFCALV
jgi:hypothetical protein